MTRWHILCSKLQAKAAESALFELIRITNRRLCEPIILTNAGEKNEFKKLLRGH
jgi:hypothetical protein